jgi:hypothetical protein
MKSKIGIILSLMLFACQNETIEENLIGNWYHCDKNGDYSEIHISSDYFEIYPSQSAPTMNAKSFYRLLHDTIIFSSEPIDSARNLVIARIHFISHNELSWQVLSDSLLEPAILKRLEFPVTKFPENSSKQNVNKWATVFEEEFNERKKIIACPDLRTHEEVLQDSLNQIDLDSINDNFEEISFD